MPKYSNSFRNPAYREETIIDESGTLMGTIRIKPSSLLWKPRGAKKFFAVPLQKFAEWITSAQTSARKTKS